MKYLGSKNKLSKELVPIIESYINDETLYYIEPFVGGANLIDKINFKRKIGSDIHKELIALLKYVQKNADQLPETISEDEYIRVKNNKDDYDPWYVGLVGFCATFGAKYFGGYARAMKSDRVTPRDMPNEAIRNLIRQSPNLENIKFSNASYETYLKYKNIKNCVIYCDIPYKDTTEYKTDSFDHERFYEWCKTMKSRGNTVLISEYNMPEQHFKVIWQKEHSTIVSLGDNKHSKRIEKLYITV